MDKVIAGEDWAKAFSQVEHRLVHHSARYQEVVSSLAEPGLAAGEFSMISTSGMEMRQIHLHTHEPLILQDADDREGIESMFLLQGGIESRFQSIGKPLSFETQRHGFQYNPTMLADHIIKPGPFQVLQVSYRLDYFKELANSAGTGPLDKVYNSLERKESFILAGRQLVVQPRMADIIRSVQQCCFQGLTKYLFIEAKLLELFALQLDQLATVGQSASREEWSRADQEKLKAVRDFIEANYLAPLTLTQLTHDFGLNEYKLKKGYKHLFNTTVFGHIHHLRMQKAQQLLISKQMNVSETAFYIGYNNIGSFSAEFKKRFGYSPSRV
ncbi:AraC family transcriptional regulator [Telluribacter sp. SYSU D00476]|uniref:helix-turn-helix transcriptional regulator n=1 Tax=Telluribacter sp. SYSU D00476 TaxID=2811430 RepID=UPI001FF505FD|nr:AraC family transcriptional regulator [Telluribacter sp. SYSU D00476]